MPCHSGLCDEGVCVTTPCQGITCIDPPDAFCTEVDRTIFAPSGYCSGGKCSYASKTSACDFSCKSGTCTDSPCTEVYCRKSPPPYCQDDKSLVVFEPEGRCTVEKERPTCLYESETVSCDHGCEGGRCQDDPCVGVYCEYPPARYCDDAVLVVFEPHGICHEGVCYYVVQRKTCIEPCVDARCGEDNACTWVTCNEPPASYCEDDSVLRVYARDGWCEDGFCSYIYSDIPCKEGCEEGRCKDDPCIGVSCDQPPAAYCDGKVLVNFEQTGTCNDGICSYPKEETSCQDGCENAECLTGGDTDTELTWILITGGTFEMGSLINVDEQPVHSVDVPSYEMTRSEITVAEYMACVTEGICTEPGTWSDDCYWNKDGFDSFPVNCVGWIQAVTFCQWKGGRLPSESQWEYAARSAGKDILYPWGDEAPSCDYAVLYEGADGCGTGLSWAVCSKPAGNTDQGLCDMGGNMIEWVQDNWHSNYEGAPADGSAWEGGGFRVTRGAGFNSNLDQVRSADRGPAFDETYNNLYLGFRCIREVQ